MILRSIIFHSSFLGLKFLSVVSGLSLLLVLVFALSVFLGVLKISKGSNQDDTAVHNNFEKHVRSECLNYLKK